ncbi:sugar-binding transcriptional regulator [Trueperella pyogenes]
MNRIHNTVDEDLLIRIAWWYHIDGLTQNAIASRLKLSRPSVGRLLDLARSRGITEVRVSPEYLRRYEVAQQIKERFGLRDVMVVPSPSSRRDDGGTDLNRLGKAAACVVEEYATNVENLAIGWGDAVATTFANLENFDSSLKTVVSLTGGVSVYAMAMAGARGGGDFAQITRFLPAPLYLHSAELAEALVKEDAISKHLSLASQADLAVIGVGGNTSTASLVTQHILTESEIKEIRASGAAGDILGVFFDQQGETLDIPLHHSRIGIALDDLRKIPTVIGVAGGAAKIPSILGALRGHYLDVLVTDMEAAQALEA